MPTDFGTAWLSRHTLRKSQMHEKNPLLRPNKRDQTPTLSPAGIAMIWSTHLRCAAVALFATVVSCAVSAWAVSSARAFTMENLSTGGNTTRFAEPDGPANNFGRGAQPFRPGWPHGAVRRSTGPADAFQSLPRLRLQLHASSAVCSPPRQRGLNQHCGSRSINRASLLCFCRSVVVHAHVGLRQTPRACR